MNSITDLYAFMESSNTTLELKVLGEVVTEEEHDAHDANDEEGNGERWQSGSGE